jgi:hypothetical protein
MKFRSLAFLLLFVPVCLFAKSYTYRMVTDTHTNLTVYWTEEYRDLGFIKVYATNVNETYDAYCLTNFEAVRWLYQNRESDTALMCERKNNLLFFSGKAKGLDMQRVVAIDTDPVYQTLTFSLAEFLRSDRDMIKFWFIIPGDYTPFKMVAYRQEKEIIKVNGVDVEAYCVMQTLDGPMRALWHAFYWFRAFDYVYVKYKGINGGPGTPVTVVELVEED